MTRLLSKGEGSGGIHYILLEFIFLEENILQFIGLGYTRTGISEKGKVVTAIGKGSVIRDN